VYVLVVDTLRYLLVLGYSYHWNVRVLNSASLMFVHCVIHEIELFFCFHPLKTSEFCSLNLIL